MTETLPTISVAQHNTKRRLSELYEIVTNIETMFQQISNPVRIRKSDGNTADNCVYSIKRQAIAQLATLKERVAILIEWQDNYSSLGASGISNEVATIILQDLLKCDYVFSTSIIDSKTGVKIVPKGIISLIASHVHHEAVEKILLTSDMKIQIADECGNAKVHVKALRKYIEEQRN